MALIDKLKSVADAIRGKTGKTEEMTLDQMATEIAGIESGGGGITVPKMAAVYFPIALSIPSNLGNINVDFGSLIDYLDAGKTYTYSLVLYKNSVTEYTDMTYMATALDILGRVGTTGSVGSVAFDYNSQVQARSSSASLTSYVQLLVSSAFSAKSITNGVASLTLSSQYSSDFIGEWVGIFTAIAPFTSAEPTNKLTECPANFLTYTEAS